MAWVHNDAIGMSILCRKEIDKWLIRRLEREIYAGCKDG
jgi:hypothetical protein